MLNPLASRKKKAEEEAKLIELHAKAAARTARLSVVDTTPAVDAIPAEGLDTRACERVMVDCPAIVICEEDTDTPATIVDMSDQGLRLRFAKRHYMAETAVIDSPAFEGFLVADVIWQSGNEAGLAIDKEWTEKLAAPLKAHTDED